MIFTFFYTGAGNKVRTNLEPDKSLGGFISESLVPNDFPSSIFGSIAGIREEKDDIIVLGLVNSESVLNGSITILDRFNSLIGFKGGLMAMVLDTCGIYKTEQVPNRFSKPRGVALNNMKSTNAFLKVELDNKLAAQTDIFIQDGLVDIVNFTTDESDVIEQIIDNIESGYYAIKKFDYKKKAYDIYIFKKELVNFDTITTTNTFTITTTQAIINELSFGDLEAESYVALYLQRDFKEYNKELKKNGKESCERLFIEFANEIEKSNAEQYQFRINYEESPVL